MPSVTLPPIAPAGDLVAAICLFAALSMACLDCHLRDDQRALPMAEALAALFVLWMGHLAAFAGLLPRAGGPAGATAGWVFLVIVLAAPAVLAASFFNRPVAKSRYCMIAGASTTGTAFGLGALALAWFAARSVRVEPPWSAPSAVGVLALLPVGLAAILVLRGRRGDRRVLSSKLVALGLAGLAAVILATGPHGETPLWNLAQLLSVLVAVALLGGMLGLYPLSVRAEQEVQRERLGLLNRALEASDAERRRIARDLHDSAVQDLAAVSFSLAGTSRRVAAGDRADLARALDQVAATTRQTMAGLRSLIVEIYPPNLHKEGIEAALADLCATARARGLHVDLKVTPGLALSDQASATVYRIAQEAVRNTLRHSRAHELVVSLLHEDGLVRLEVADDGRGFDGQSASTDDHLGLRLVSDLAREVGANLEIESRPGGGTVVRLQMG